MDPSPLHVPRADSEFPPLPPLEDDSPIAGLIEDDTLERSEEDAGLDDATMGDEVVGDEVMIDREGEEPLDDLEGAIDPDDDRDVALGDERGLLAGSDEPAGNHFAPGEIEVEPESDAPIDDGGAEGTHEDPAAILADEGTLAASANEDPDAEVPADDAVAIGGRGGAILLDRASWPRIGKTRWELAVDRIDPSSRRRAPEPAALSIERLARLPDATCEVSLPASTDVIVALWDAARGAVGFVLLDALGSATLIAEHLFPIDEEQDDAVGAVTELRVEPIGSSWELVASTNLATLRLRPPR